MYGMFSIICIILKNATPFLKKFCRSPKRDKKLVFPLTVWYSVDDRPVSGMYRAGVKRHTKAGEEGIYDRDPQK